MQTCKTCKWWKNWTDMIDVMGTDDPMPLPSHVGYCKRYPPTRFIGFPKTYRTDSCGEHTPTTEAMVRKIAEWMNILLSDPTYWNDEGGLAIAHQEGFVKRYFAPHTSAADRERVMAKSPTVALRHLVNSDGTHICGLVDMNTHNPQKSWWGQGDTWGIAFVNAWDNRLDYLAAQEQSDANP